MLIRVKVWAFLSCFALAEAMEQASKSTDDLEVVLPNALKVVSWNIDTNLGRTEEGYARDSHPQWRVGERMSKILENLGAIISEHNPHVVNIQEARKCQTKFGDEVNSIDPVMDFLSSKGYQVSSQGYNPSDRSFSYITAVHQDFKVEKTQSLFFTLTPNEATDHSLPLEKVKDHNFGEEWERSAYITTFSTEKGEEFHNFNVHLGLTLNHRKKASELLSQWACEFTAKNPKTHVIITGDFNTFPDWGGEDQINLIKDARVLSWDSQSLIIKGSNDAIASSFFAFPFDFASEEKRLNLTSTLISLDPEKRREKINYVFKTECKALGGQLDQVFSYGFENVNVLLQPTPIFGKLEDGYSEESVKKYIVVHFEDGPAFASDHQPLIITAK